MKKSNRLALLLMAVLCLLTACTARQETEKPAAGDQPSFTVYYMNEEQTGLKSILYHPEGETFDEILGELLAQLQKDPASDMTRFPEGVEIKGFTKSIDNVTIDLNSAYLALGNVQEILIRAAMVKTLAQLPGVAGVALTVDEQPLTDQDGTTVGAMSSDLFIDTGGMGINSYAYRTCRLYFPNAEGKLLRSESREAFSSTNLLPERVVIEQIIAGPESRKLQPAVSPRVKINSVRMNNDILQVDLDDVFTEPYGENVSARAALYSLVNSIFEVTEATGIRFTVNGKSDVRFRNEIGLDQTFVQDLELIDETQTEKQDGKKRGTASEAAPPDAEGAEAQSTSEQAEPEVQESTPASDEQAGTNKKKSKKAKATEKETEPAGTIEVSGSNEPIVGIPSTGNREDNP